MAVSLTKPAIGSTGWGQDVNDNFTTVEDCFNGDTEIGPLKIAEDAWVGVGAAAERLVFNGGSDRIEVRDAELYSTDNFMLSSGGLRHFSDLTQPPGGPIRGVP